MFRLTHCVLVLSVDVSLGATGGEEEDVVTFVGGDSAGEDEGMRLCIGGDEVGDPPQAAFHVGPGWAPVGQSWAPNGPRMGPTGAHLGMLLGS